MAYTILELGEEADFEAQVFSFAQKFNRRTAVGFRTKPAILPPQSSSEAKPLLAVRCFCSTLSIIINFIFSSLHAISYIPNN